MIEQRDVQGAMQDPARALYRAAEVRAIDARTIEQAGIPGMELMARAAGAAWQQLVQCWPEPRPLAVLCGPGNNGGDGFLVARAAREAGWPVEAFVLSGVLDAHRDASGDAATALAELRDSGVTPQPVARFDPSRFAIAVDALFGTGLARALEGEARDAVEAINRVPGPRLALDIPSGLHADTGNAMGACVNAARTVTFIALKQGLFTGDGPSQVGELALADLDVPDWVYPSPDALLARFEDRRGCLGPRHARDHKGRFGHVLVMGGDRGFAGAASLAAQAAARVGAGLVSVATRPEHVSPLIAARAELMVRGVDAPPSDLIDAASVIAVGPGLGRGAWGRHLLDAALDAEAALVVDADALNQVADDSLLRERLCARRAHTVVTPHPGEASRLLGVSTREVEADRFDAASMLAESLSASALLKGAGTIVAAAARPSVVCDTGHPAMASGGMGDVLTGVIAALMAQGLAGAEAAITGALLHGEAARVTVRRRGLERGLLAGDLLDELPVLASRL